MKKYCFIAMLLICCTFFSSVVYASELNYDGESFYQKKLIEEVVSEEFYDDWRLTWRYEEQHNDLLMKISKDKECIEYKYNETFQRIEKEYTDGSKVTFIYDENFKLIKEKSNNIEIEYMYSYDENGCVILIEGFVYNGEIYKYIYENDIIVGLSKNNEEIVRYEYDIKVCVDTLELKDGEWVSNKDEKFIGNINKIRYKGYYYDDETGWYYNGRFFDPKSNVFVDGLNFYQAQKLISQYGIEYEAEILLASNFFGVDMLEGEQCNTLARVTTYGEIETIARVLYAESNNSINDQACVAWVIYNRSKSSAWKSKEPYDIVTSGEFSGFGSKDYYNPVQTKSTWESAVNDAVRLSVGNTPYRKPSNFSNQCYFASIKTFQNGFAVKDGVFYFRGNKISKVYIVGYGVITNSNVLLSQEIKNLSGTYNVFYFR